MIGWIGWMGSYNGRFFDGGYSGHSVGKTKRDYISEQIRNTESQIDNIKSVDFRYSSYENLILPENSVIYCDIPYKNTKKYSTSKDFNYDKFWDWCRVTSSSDKKIFISEYEAPTDFECVWEKELTNSMNTTKTYKPTEKLFTI
jgi:DNA adenine methylase